MRQLAPRVLQLVVLILLALLVLAPLRLVVPHSRGRLKTSSAVRRRCCQPHRAWTLPTPVSGRSPHDLPAEQHRGHALAVVANLLFCSLAAYPWLGALAGRGVVLALVVATILIPFQVVMIPLYLLMVQLGRAIPCWR